MRCDVLAISFQLSAFRAGLRSGIEGSGAFFLALLGLGLGLCVGLRVLFLQLLERGLLGLGLGPALLVAHRRSGSGFLCLTLGASREREAERVEQREGLVVAPRASGDRDVQAAHL